MFKIKIALFFTPCASFLGLPAQAPNPPKRGAGFFYHHMAQHRKGATRAYQSRSPREAAKNAKKGKHEKRYPYRGFLFRKKKTHRFSKNPVKTQAVVPIFDVYVFFSHQKVLTMIHFGGPAFFQKRATQHLNEKYVQNDEK